MIHVRHTQKRFGKPFKNAHTLLLTFINIIIIYNYHCNFYSCSQSSSSAYPGIDVVPLTALWNSSLFWTSLLASVTVIPNTPCISFSHCMSSGLSSFSIPINQHSRQMFDWLRALNGSSFCQPKWPISTQHYNNKCVPQLILGPFWTFWRVFTDRPTKNIARLRNAILSLIFCLIGPYTLPFNLYWRRQYNNIMVIQSAVGKNTPKRPKWA